MLCLFGRKRVFGQRNKTESEALTFEIESYIHKTYTSSTDTKKIFTLSMSNQTGIHQFNTESVALESYLEEVKMQLAETKIIKPKHNLSRNERKALNELKHHTEINLKKADKGSTTVVMNKNDKIREGQQYKSMIKTITVLSYNPWSKRHTTKCHVSFQNCTMVTTLTI